MFDPGKGTIAGGAWDLGCDPEVFIIREGKKKWHVMGSERLLGEKATKGPVAVDGVQIELHPTFTTCRANVGNSIQACFKDLKVKMDKFPEKLNVDFSTQVRVTKTELLRLSENSRRLGCLPSFNAYGLKWKEPKGMPLARSGAGHIHFGSGKAIQEPDKFAQLLDVLVGIPCVLIDRAPESAKRRKMYGKAGEYRLPKHGFEYRTLSNFWLRHYAIFSLVFGMAKTTGAIEYTHLNKKLYNADPYYKTYRYNVELRDRLLAAVDFKKVQKAINTNDFDLASEIFEEFVRPVYNAVDYDGGIGICKSTMPKWDYLVKKGLDNFFPADNAKILDHWLTKPEGHYSGWETYASRMRVERGEIKIDPITNKAIG